MLLFLPIFTPIVSIRVVTRDRRSRDRMVIWISSTIKTERHDKTEIVFILESNTITPFCDYNLLSVEIYGFTCIFHNMHFKRERTHREEYNVTADLK